MKKEDFKMICIKDDNNTWCVYLESIPGLIVQVDDLKTAPEELAKAFEVMLQYGYDTKNYDIYEIQPIQKG